MTRESLKRANELDDELYTINKILEDLKAKNSCELKTENTRNTFYEGFVSMLIEYFENEKQTREDELTKL
jgi:hypothetical protein